MKDNGVLHRKDNGFCSSETHSVHQTDLYAVDSPVGFFYLLTGFRFEPHILQTNDYGIQRDIKSGSKMCNSGKSRLT